MNQPPVNNDHVAPGCEQFDTPASTPADAPTADATGEAGEIPTVEQLERDVIQAEELARLDTGQDCPVENHALAVFGERWWKAAKYALDQARAIATIRDECARHRDAMRKLRAEIAPLAAQIICPKDNTFSRQLAIIDAASRAGTEGK